MFRAQNEKLRGLKFPVELAGLLRERRVKREQVKRSFTEGRITEKGRLPLEVLEMVRGYFREGLPMTRQEAEGYRLKLMKGRTGFQQKARDDCWEDG